MNNRDTSDRDILIDALRLIFSFFVVTIHIPMIGGTLLAPIYRCAVPFFYVVTGYYLYSETNLESRLRKASKKWLLLFLKYFAIITTISLVIHECLHQKYTVTFSDLFYLLCGNGSIPNLDIVHIRGVELGLYVLWFLLSGCYALYILSVLHALFKNYIFIGGALLYMLCYLGDILGYTPLRLFYLSIPFLTLGFFIKKYNTTLFCLCNIHMFLVFVVALIGEFLLYRHYSIKVECFFFVPIILTIIFVNVVDHNMSLILWGGHVIDKFAILGRNCSLHIYIYHRLIFVVMVFLFGQDVSAVGAPLCFGMTLVIIVVYKYIWKILLKQNQ